MTAISRADEHVHGRSGYKGSRSPVAEAYRVLRTNLQFAAVDRELKVVLVTSPSPDEGKSTVAQFLAQTISQTGKRVMILDTDLINPTLHKRFGLPNQKGLSNLIMGETDPTATAHPQAYPNLSVITSGPIPPNSSELLGSARMKHLIDRMREEYDMIIVDSPPVLVVTDAVVTSSLTDGVILVIHAGRTHSGDVRRAQEALEGARANLLGAVLNRVHLRGNEYRYAHSYTVSGVDSARAGETPKTDS